MKGGGGGGGGGGGLVLATAWPLHQLSRERRSSSTGRYRGTIVHLTTEVCRGKSQSRLHTTAHSPLGGPVSCRDRSRLPSTLSCGPVALWQRVAGQAGGASSVTAALLAGETRLGEGRVSEGEGERERESRPRVNSSGRTPSLSRCQLSPPEGSSRSQTSSSMLIPRLQSEEVGAGARGGGERGSPEDICCLGELSTHELPCHVFGISLHCIVQTLH